MNAWNPPDPTDYADPPETVYFDGLDIPQPVPHSDWALVREYCIDYVTDANANEDLRHYIFEAAIDAVFGPRVAWAYLNRTR
jgi:hypothetical protein